MSARFRSGTLAVLLGAALVLGLAPTNAFGLFTASRAVGANTLSTNTLAPPTGLAASVSGTNVTLTWNATPSALRVGIPRAPIDDSGRAVYPDRPGDADDDADLRRLDGHRGHDLLLRAARTTRTG